MLRSTPPLQGRHSPRGRPVTRRARRGINQLSVLVSVSLVAAILLGYFLFRPQFIEDRQDGKHLKVYCAAGMRYPMEQLATDYVERYGVRIELQYGGSNSLLSQIEVGRLGDLYLAGDSSYTQLGRDKGLLREVLPLASMRPVVVVRKSNPKNIRQLDDLLRSDVQVALGNPDAAAIGRVTRELLTASGHWNDLQQAVTENGVFKTTVNEVANDVKVGSVDAGIVWDSTVAQYPELMAVGVAELDAGRSSVEIAVLEDSKQPAVALRFARFVAARDEGLAVFRQKGFQTVEGDRWEESPELTFFAGAVNRRALEVAIAEFQKREGVTVNTVYNGCGILTGTMRQLTQDAGSGFPDSYMACDQYYLDTVQDWFQEAVTVSETDIVIVVPQGNPNNIRSLHDLVRPGIRVALGQPEQCTIGVLSKQLLESQQLYDQIMAENVVTQTTSSALLVPNVVTGSVDAALAYASDVQAVTDKTETIRIDSPLAKAVQPFSIARSSQLKHLSRRLLETVRRHQQDFEAAGFRWLLDQDPQDRHSASSLQP